MGRFFSLHWKNKRLPYGKRTPGGLADSLEGDAQLLREMGAAGIEIGDYRPGQAQLCTTKPKLAKRFGLKEMASGTQHKQTKIEFGGLRADVDEGIAPLILALWKAGILTLLSCQELEPGFVWLVLPWTDVEPFLTIVTGRGACEFLKCRAMNWSWATPDDWLYRVIAHQHGRGRNRAVTLSLSVMFPHSDLPTVLKLVERAEGQYLSWFGQIGTKPA
jgi:hypothetical protein